MKNTRIQHRKMSPVKIMVACFIAMFMIYACKSPSKLYDQGKYDKAFEKSFNSLNKGSKKREEIKILNNSLEKLLEEKSEKINTLTAGKLDDKEKAYDVYGKAIKQFDKAQKYYNDQTESRMNLFLNDRDILADDLSETYSKVADRNLDLSMANNSKADAQKAYYQYDKALYYLGKEDAQLEKLQQKSLELGIVNYSVQLKSHGFDWGMKREINSRFESIESDLDDIFVNIVYNGEMNQVDCLVELDFSDLDQDEDVRSSNRTYDERVITGYNTEVDTSGNKTDVPIYETVEGTVRTNKVTRVSEIELRISVDGDRKDCKIKNQRLDEDFKEELEFYETYGDDRAIPTQFTRRNTDEFEDSDDVMEDLIEELYRDFLRKFN